MSVSFSCIAPGRLRETLLGLAQPAERLHEASDLTQILRGDARAIDERTARVAGVDVVDGPLSEFVPLRRRRRVGDRGGAGLGGHAIMLHTNSFMLS